MTTNRRLLRVAFLAAILAAPLAGCGDDASSPSGGAAGDPGAAARALPVETAVAGTRDIDVSLEAVGTAYASGLVDVRPQVDGTFVEAPFVEGDLVAAGQVLARLDDSKARASLALAQAQLDSAKARLAVATERLGRFRRLAAEDLVSREEYATLESEQKAADAAVREKESEVRLAERNLEDYTLRAPVAGRMGIRRVDTGNYLEAGTVIATLVVDDPLEVLFTVPGTESEGLEVGRDVDILDTDPARTVLAPGRIRVLDARIDTGTRMLSVKALVANPDRKVKAGQFVGVRLVRERRPGAVVVPEDAVLAQGGRTWVFVVSGDTAARREVTLGQRVPGLVEVRSGVAAGETIVTRGQHRLSDGARVERRGGAATSAPAAGSDAAAKGDAPATPPAGR